MATKNLKKQNVVMFLAYFNSKIKHQTIKTSRIG